MRKKLRLLFQINQEQKLTTAYCLILLFFLAFSLDTALALLAGNQYRVTMAGLVKDSVGYIIFHEETETGQVDPDREEQEQEKQKQAVLSQLEKQKGVSEVAAVACGMCEMSKNGREMLLFDYGGFLRDGLHYSLLEGRRPETNQEMVLCASARGIYHLGDEITISDGDGTVQITVVGFLQNDLFFYPNLSCEQGEEKGECSYGSMVNDFYADAQDGTYTGIIAGEPLKDMEYLDTVFIRGDQPEAILKELDGKYGYGYWMRNLLTEYKHDFCRLTSQESFWLVVCLGILFVAGFCIQGPLYLYRNRKEYAIYYMCGCTWQESVCLSYARNLLLFLVAVPLGFLAFRILRFTDDAMVGYILSVPREALVFTCMLAAYTICCIPGYLYFRRQDPVDIYRMETREEQ